MVGKSGCPSMMRASTFRGALKEIRKIAEKLGPHKTDPTMSPWTSSHFFRVNNKHIQESLLVEILDDKTSPCNQLRNT